MKRKQRLLVACVPVAAVLASLAACQSRPEPRQTAERPVPAEVQRRLESVRSERTEYPEFADIPPPPGAVRTPAQWAEFVRTVEGQGAVLQAWAAANPAWSGDRAAFEAAARRALADAGAPPPADQQAITEAWAARTRARAVPPRPPQ